MTPTIKKPTILLVLPLLLGSAFAAGEARVAFAASVASEDKAYTQSEAARVVLESNLLDRPTGAPQPRGAVTPQDADRGCLKTHLDKAYGGC